MRNTSDDAPLHQRMVAEVVPPYTDSFVGTLCGLRDLSTISKGAHEMTIMILAVAGIWTDDRQNEIHKPAR